MTVRTVDEPHEAECESKLRKYGFILTYGTTTPNVKVSTLGGYPVGVSLQPTKKFDGTLTSNVRITYQKAGTVKVFKRGGVASILLGDAIMSDASGCAARLAAAKFIGGPSSFALASRSMVGVSDDAITTAASGFIKVYLKIHQTAKP